jgi:hypothetical protein
MRCDSTSAMPLAIIKISWATDECGRYAGHASGGMCGTCFTLENGVTLTSLQLTWDLFEPNAGCHACRVFLTGQEGDVREVRQEQLRLDPVHGLAAFLEPDAPGRFALAEASASPDVCAVEGYLATSTPFRTAIAADGRLEIVDTALSVAGQHIANAPLTARRLDVSADDLSLSDVPGLMIEAPSLPGLAGAPVMEAESGAVLGVCLFGLPADANGKTQLGAVDIRSLPLAGAK